MGRDHWHGLQAGLLARQGKRYVTIVASLGTRDGIVLRGRDSVVLQIELADQPDVHGYVFVSALVDWSVV